MEILVLVKAVPDSETRLRPNADGTAPDLDGAKFVLSGYDESAVEQALLLKESVPGSAVRAVSFGVVARAEEVLRSALALGCDSATIVEAPPNGLVDPAATARALAAALARYRFDLLLGGKQAGDDEAGIVVPAVASLLGVAGFWPVVDLRWAASDGRFTFQVAVDGGSDRIRTSPPLVVGLQQAWNDPRTARLPNILKSRRATIDRIPWTEVESSVAGSIVGTPLAFRLPAPRTGAKMIAFKDPADAADQLLRLLRDEAKVFP